MMFSVKRRVEFESVVLVARHVLQLAAASCLALGVMVQTAAAAAPYRLPYDLVALRAAPANAKLRNRACPALIDPPFQLQHGPRYAQGDATASVVDAARAAAEIEATKSVRLFNRVIADTSDYAIKAPQFAAAQSACVIAHLDHWAKGNAFLGLNSMQGEFEKKWGAINYSLGFIEARTEASAEQVDRIKTWLRRLGTDVYDYYSGPTNNFGLNSKSNNHAYWAALSAVSVGMAVDDSKLFDWGMKRFLAALGDINAGGFLPMELKRGSRALEYHRFAAEPLVLLAVIARANGVEIPVRKELALKRLVNRLRDGLDDHSAFVRATGLRQEGTEIGRDWEWGWAELALKVFPDAALNNRIAKGRPYFHIWLGGGLTIRYLPAGG